MIPPPPNVDVPAHGRSVGGRAVRVVRRIFVGPRTHLTPRRTHLTLRARVSLLVAVVVGLVVAVMSSVAYVTVRAELLHQLDASLRSRAVAAAAVQLDPASILDQSTLVVLTAENKVFLVSADGDVIGSIRDRDFAAALANGPELAVAQGKLAWSLRTVTVDGVAYRMVAVPSAPGQALVLARSMTETAETLARLGFVLLAVGVAGIAVAAFSGLTIARAGLRPVERLTAAAERVARTGDLTPIDIDRDDEIGRLAQSFNAMLVALDRSQQLQRQLVADAGHELRTPLTSLRTNLDLLAQSEAAGDRGLSRDDRLALLADVRAQVEELSGLVADLVELARDDVPDQHLEEVDLATVAERAVERVRRRASGLRFDISLQPWLVYGDPTMLERAVTNLLDNAVKWSPPGGRVELRLENGRLTVTDEGPGISDVDLPHIFDRFYRSADARKMPGSGLGLAIVRHAALRHGGTIQAGKAPSGGALFVMELPGRPVSAGEEYAADAEEFAAEPPPPEPPPKPSPAISQEDRGVLRR
ncbi:MAG: HAMP domain-containing histidine kinase [Acidothermus cellulolyticus]|nr:HAMP domain-containing histidine kinase [Acidothermus cellulolyticus]